MAKWKAPLTHDAAKKRFADALNDAMSGFFGTPSDGAFASIVDECEGTFNDLREDGESVTSARESTNSQFWESLREGIESAIEESLDGLFD
jgi:hypothetical protein